MSEISSSKQFMISLNQQFPGGSLFLLLTDQELKKLLMYLASTMLESDSTETCKHAVRIIGQNQLKEEGSSPFWVFSKDAQITHDGHLVTEPPASPFLWLQKLVNGNNILVQESLQCSISTPLDNGQSFIKLCLAMRSFMPENFTAAMATISAVLMGANYTTILVVVGSQY